MYRRVESLSKLLTANKVLFDLPTKILSILKVVSVESLAGNDFSERGTQGEAHCERNLNRQKHRIVFRPATTQLRRTTKCVCNIVFRFVYRSVEHAVLEVSVRFSKVADNI